MATVSEIISRLHVTDEMIRSPLQSQPVKSNFENHCDHLYLSNKLKRPLHLILELGNLQFFPLLLPTPQTPLPLSLSLSC